MSELYEDIEPRMRRALDNLFPALAEAQPQWDAVVSEALTSGRRIRNPIGLFAGRKRPLAIAFTVTVALVAIATATLPVTVFSDRQLGAGDAAAQVLGRAAESAKSSATAGSGPYLYTKVKVIEAGIGLQVPQPHTVLVPRVRETWLAADGSGRVRETTGQPIFPSARDRERWHAAGEKLPSAGTTTDDTYGPRDYLADDAALPVDVSALRAALEDRARQLEQPLAAALIRESGDLLGSAAASPALRSALYQMIAQMDGVQLDGPTTDSEGRSGMAISVPAGYGASAGELRQVLVFDPQTAVVLESRSVLVRPVAWTGATPPTVIGSTTYLASVRVSDTSATAP